jgi:lactoylglutathione lyase
MVMVSQLGQVMLYVKDQEASARFWSEVVGFEIVGRHSAPNGMKWIEIAPPGAQTTLVLHDKEAVAKMAPELHLGTPSLMFFSPSVQALKDKLVAQGVTTGPVVDMPQGRVFNFADAEGNYFAVMER